MGRVQNIRPSPLAVLCQQRRAALVEMTTGVHVVVWLDNFNCLKYAPVPESSNRSLEAMAICLLHDTQFDR